MARTLGSTPLEVSQLGVGLAALGRPGYINLGHASDLAGRTDEAAMEAHAHAVLDAAYAAGVRYFDAARSYGRAESFLGSWLTARGFAPGEVTVGSKWGYTYTAGWRIDAEVNEVKDLSLATLRRQQAESARAARAVPAPLPDPLGHARQRRPRRPRGPRGAGPARATGDRRSASRSRAPAGRDDRPRARAVGGLRRRPGDVEPARALGRAGARRRRTPRASG